VDIICSLYEFCNNAFLIYGHEDSKDPGEIRRVVSKRWEGKARQPVTGRQTRRTKRSRVGMPTRRSVSTDSQPKSAICYDSMRTCGVPTSTCPVPCSCSSSHSNSRPPHFAHATLETCKDGRTYIQRFLVRASLLVVGGQRVFQPTRWPATSRHV